MTDLRSIDPAVRIDPDEVLAQMRTLLRRARTRPAAPGDTQQMYTLVAQLDAWSSAGGYPPGHWHTSERVRKLARKRTWRQTTCGCCGMYITGNPEEPAGEWRDMHGYTRQPPAGSDFHKHRPHDAGPH
jgi:hypothetical protein